MQIVCADAVVCVSWKKEERRKEREKVTKGLRGEGEERIELVAKTAGTGRAEYNTSELSR